MRWGKIIKVDENDTFIMRVPHLQTNAVLALLERDGKYFYGWQNWNGFRNDGKDDLRWAKHRFHLDEAEEEFHKELERGPKKLEPANRKPIKSRFEKWWMKECHPMYGDEPEMSKFEVERFLRKIYKNGDIRFVPDVNFKSRGLTYYDRQFNIPKWGRRKYAILQLVALVNERKIINGDLNPDFAEEVMKLHVKYLDRNPTAIRVEFKEYGII